MDIKYDKILDEVRESDYQDLSGYIPYTGANADVDLGEQSLTAQQIITTGSSTITYDGDFIDEITIGTRTITYSNDGTNYTSWTDGTYTWTPTYNGTTGLLEGVTVT